MDCWSITDKGIVRKQNEDALSLFISEDKGMIACVVCDGMGGALAGDVASQLAADTFMSFIVASSSHENMQSLLENAVKSANSAVYEKAYSDKNCRGMGTTLVSVVVLGHNAFFVNVGDSRGYRISANKISQITRDHSVVEDMVTRGDLTREQARTHPKKNLVTRVLGTEAVVPSDYYHEKLVDGDYILLCSDGLSNILTEQEILYEVLHGGEDEQCCLRLLEAVKDRGAPDNVTIALIRV